MLFGSLQCFTQEVNAVVKDEINLQETEMEQQVDEVSWLDAVINSKRFA